MTNDKNEEIEKISNEYISLWKMIDSLSPELQEIYWANWDETGRPTNENPHTRLLISVLNKNFQEGYQGVKKDMNSLYKLNRFSEEELKRFYDIHIAGAKNLADRLYPPAINTKPKM